MAIVGIVLLLAAPFLFGVGISCTHRERSVGYLKGYLVGFLSLFVMLFIETLAMLKLDLTLAQFEWAAVGTLIAMAAIGAVLMLIKRPHFIKPGFDAHALYFIVPAILLFAYSYCYLAPSFANDDTWEIVSTSLARHSIYEYSAMTGRLMEQGLPIFNKIYVMPLLYIVLADFFGVPVSVSAGILMPALVYVLNLAVVYAIGRKLALTEVHFYMVAYLLLLIAGTYLPTFGVPVTLGYPLLREGYSGYAVAYGVVIPAVLFLLLHKKYLWAIVTFMVNAPLVRADRIVFALSSPVRNFHDINTAGKLAGIFMAAVVAAAVMGFVLKKKLNFFALLVPSVFIAYVCESLKDVINDKKMSSFIFTVGIAVIILSAVNFQPFDDAETYGERKRIEATVKASLEEIKPDRIVWGPEEFMAVARRINGSITTLSGRDDANSYMAGLDYEKGAEMVIEYRNTLKNIASGQRFYVTEHDEKYVVNRALDEGAYYLVIPTGESYKVMKLSDYVTQAYGEQK